MSNIWAERQRCSNRLARAIAAYLFNQKEISPSQLYGIAKLAWITNSYQDDDAAYIRSTKIPALGNIFNEAYAGATLIEVAHDIAAKTKNNDIAGLVLSHTGFTNFYKAYRNSSAQWIEKNHSTLEPMFRMAYLARTNKDRLELVRGIHATPGIPKANHEDQLMRPEYFLTPAFFCLDPEIKFPLINGNEWVHNLLNALKVADSSLEKQYDAMVKLYGIGGIKDAADLDQVRRDLPDFIASGDKGPIKKLLEQKETKEGSNLRVKDEADIESLLQARSITQRKIHNKVTNKLKEVLPGYTLLEGCDKQLMFDVLVKNYDVDRNDLLIEVKSSIETAHIRMAVGQLFDYWFHLKGDEEPHLAVLLPSRPEQREIDMLHWLGVGVMWFNDDRLVVADEWLEHLAVTGESEDTEEW